MLNIKGKRSKMHRVLVSFTPEEYHLVDAATPFIKEATGRTSLGYLCKRASVALAKETLKSVGILGQVLNNYKDIEAVQEAELVRQSAGVNKNVAPPEEPEVSGEDILKEVLGDAK